MTNENVEGLPGAREIILNELTKRIASTFPDAQVKLSQYRQTH